ncbi:hypothetical protein AX16_007376, partial [Volvariella volvacea WC 439]
MNWLKCLIISLWVLSTLAAPSAVVFSNDTTPSSNHQSACSTTISPEHLRNIERVFRAIRTPPSLLRGPNDGPAVIPVYWHVIAVNRTIEGGWVSHEQITEQMNVLNRDFVDAGLTFNHIETFRVIQPTWFSNAEASVEVEFEMKTRLKKGGPETLNIYTIQMAGGGLGSATFPGNYQFGPIIDGIYLNYYVLPGGAPPYNIGRTLTHEVGHWVGLYHTFEGGCDGGDEVDTPAEAEQAFGCQTGRDSCPGDPGVDPV